MQQDRTFEEPRFAQWLFASPQAAWIWLIARLYLGYEWLHAGFEDEVRSNSTRFSVYGSTYPLDRRVTWPITQSLSDLVSH